MATAVVRTVTIIAHPLQVLANASQHHCMVIYISYHILMYICHYVVYTGSVALCYLNIAYQICQLKPANWEKISSWIEPSCHLPSLTTARINLPEFHSVCLLLSLMDVHCLGGLVKLSRQEYRWHLFSLRCACCLWRS